jgi:hypothetical protein
MMMRNPPNADEYKTQYVGQKFRSHHQKAVRQSGGNVLALHLRHVDFQHKERNYNGKNPVAERLDP